MSLLSSFLLMPFQHPIFSYEFITSTIVLIVVFFLSRFYLQVLRYPKGPFPYPLIGNLSYMNTLNNVDNPHCMLIKLQLKYGPVFTIWISHIPFVFICDPQLVKEAFQKPEFSDRGFTYAGKVLTMNKGLDLVFNNYNKAYIEHKKLVLLALRKYVMTDELSKSTSESVEEFWDEIKRKGLEKSIDMPKYLPLIVAKIMARSLYGAKYTLNDPELLSLMNALKKINQSGDILMFLDGLPHAVAQFLVKWLIKTSWMGFSEVTPKMRIKYQQHLDSYESGRIQDVVDALIAAKEEAIQENKESAMHLNDINLSNILSDLFLGSIDTTTCMSEWNFMLMAKYPEMQTKMRQEIREVIGKRMPMQKDKDNCHFTMAFINESLRLHSPIALGVAHQTKTDVEIGKHKIPGQTTIISYLHGIHRNTNYWSQPDQFNPNRFLDADGKLQTNRPVAAMPFGSGRRACPGEKLALIDGFLIVARMLQLTDQMGLEFASDGPISVEPNPKTVAVLQPKHYKLVLRRPLNNNNNI